MFFNTLCLRGIMLMYTAVTMALLQFCRMRSCGELISVGKVVAVSKKFSTFVEEDALTGASIGTAVSGQWEAWYTVDLLGYFTLDYMTIIAKSEFGWPKYTQDVVVRVSETNPECPGAELMWCGTTPSALGAAQEVTIICNQSIPFPVRYVKLSRYSPPSSPTVYLAMQLLQIFGIDNPTHCRGSNFVKGIDIKASQITDSIEANDQAQCFLLCHKHQECLHFSYNPAENPNCLFTNRLSTEIEVGWSHYTKDEC